MLRLFPLILALVCLPRWAVAEDATDTRGNYSGCYDFTVGAAWSAVTSVSLESEGGSGVLDAGLYWMEVTVTGTSATVYVCTAAAASCGADTTNKRAVAAGAAWTLPLRGKRVTSVSLRAGGAGVTGQICGYFRTIP